MAGLMRDWRARRAAASLARLVCLLFFFLVGGYPLIWMATGSLRPTGEINDRPWGLPSRLYLENYRNVLDARFAAPGRPTGGGRQFVRYYLNSIAVSSLSVAAIVALSCPAAYAIARMRFRGSGLLFTCFLAGMMIPVHVTLVPLIKLHAFLGTYDTILSLILTYTVFGLPLSIFVLQGFFREIPRDLMDAARVDGCSAWGGFYHVALPLAGPALAAVLILNFVSIWNEFIFARTLINTPKARTLPYGLTEFARASEHATDVGAVAAALVLSALPLIVFYAFCQRRIIGGLTAGALKG